MTSGYVARNSGVSENGGGGVGEGLVSQWVLWMDLPFTMWQKGHKLVFNIRTLKKATLQDRQVQVKRRH